MLAVVFKEATPDAFESLVEVKATDNHALEGSVQFKIKLTTGFDPDAVSPSTWTSFPDGGGGGLYNSPAHGAWRSYNFVIKNDVVTWPGGNELPAYYRNSGQGVRTSGPPFGYEYGLFVIDAEWCCGDSVIHSNRFRV